MEISTEFSTERSIERSTDGSTEGSSLEQEIRYQGYLLKKTKKSTLGKHRWVKRYFVLSKDELKYYKNEEMFIKNLPSKGSIDLKSILEIDMESQSSDNDLDFTINTNNASKLELRADNEKIYNEWVEMLDNRGDLPDFFTDDLHKILNYMVNVGIKRDVSIQAIIDCHEGNKAILFHNITLYCFEKNDIQVDCKKHIHMFPESLMETNVTIVYEKSVLRTLAEVSRYLVLMNNRIQIYESHKESKPIISLNILKYFCIDIYDDVSIIITSKHLTKKKKCTMFKDNKYFIVVKYSNNNDRNKLINMIFMAISKSKKELKKLSNVSKNPYKVEKVVDDIVKASYVHNVDDYKIDILRKEEESHTMLNWIRHKHKLLCLYYVFSQNGLPRKARLFLFFFGVVWNLFWTIFFVHIVSKYKEVIQSTVTITTSQLISIIMRYAMLSLYSQKNEKTKIIMVILIITIIPISFVIPTIYYLSTIGKEKLGLSIVRFCVNMLVGFVIEFVGLSIAYQILTKYFPSIKLDDSEISNDDFNAILNIFRRAESIRNNHEIKNERIHKFRTKIYYMIS